MEKNARNWAFFSYYFSSFHVEYYLVNDLFIAKKGY